MKRKNVLVAMSGGVDSSVAAAVLARRGFQVKGVTMLLASETGSEHGNSTVFPESVSDARMVCRRLGIEHETIDLRDQFRSEVVEPFISSYLSGRTPNPCILCNEHVKFRFLLEKASVSGADMVATGHYSRILETMPRGLARGMDREKDQSYFLFFLGQAELERLVLPLGGMTKDEVRKKAREFDLPVHEKGESQDACFVQPEGVRGFLSRNTSLLPGPGWFVDKAGNRLGTHGGACFFTVGQRKGLGIAASFPLYVVKINAAANEVVLGSREDVSFPELVLSNPRWVSGTPPGGPFRSLVQIRHRQKPVGCRAFFLPNQTLRVIFDEPQHGVAPGQAAVFYDDEKVLGGGWITDGEATG